MEISFDFYKYSYNLSRQRKSVFQYHIFMQNLLLTFLKCPLTKTDLRFEHISDFEKQYSSGTMVEIKEGLLFSKSGFIFPIIDGVPRMLIEAIYDYADFIARHFSGYEQRRKELEFQFPGLLAYCIKKNKRTKQSFDYEWGILSKDKKDKIWHFNISELQTVFLNETGENVHYFNGKTGVDVGCGHGIMTSKIAEISNLCLGVELSKAVESAYSHNKCSRAMYIQGDLQFLPFANATFDVLYSSGVIHHTNNTELSFSLIEKLVKPNGKICLWLYHPQQNIGHNFLLAVRGFSRKLPLKFTAFILWIFVLPFMFAIKKLKGNKELNYREELIDLLDAFTPEFREEIPHDVATCWLKSRDYQNVAITTENDFGFSIVGTKVFF